LLNSAASKKRKLVRKSCFQFSVLGDREFTRSKKPNTGRGATRFGKDEGNLSKGGLFLYLGGSVALDGKREPCWRE